MIDEIYFEDIHSRRVDIWDLEGLLNEGGISFIYDNLCTNNRFGHAYHLKKYSGISETEVLNCTIEHGMNIVHDAVCANEVSQRCKTIITYSQHRKEIIEKHTDIKAEVVGPYIAYAEDFYSKEEQIRIKEKLGHTLLVFPKHNGEVISANYNIIDFIKEIDIIAKSFDSILVSLFYKDITERTIELYKEIGCEIVSPGCANNINYLPRLRSIISLADAIMANSFSTVIAYSLYFDKPIFLFEQEITLQSLNVSNEGALEVNDKYLKELLGLCSDTSFGNLKQQKEWGKYMFGLDKVMTKEEMRKLLIHLLRIW